MTVRYFALVLGVVYAVVGILGFFPTFTTQPSPDAPSLVLETGYGLLFGLFPINWLHNLVHLAVGIWGIVAYSSFPSARLFARGIAIIFAVLTIFGFLPVLQTLFGLAPLFGNDIWLHALTALAGAYFGWFATVERTEAY